MDQCMDRWICFVPLNFKDQTVQDTLKSEGLIHKPSNGNILQGGPPVAFVGL